MANEKRLIDANALYEKAYLPIDYSGSAVYEMSVTLRDIDNAPTVDAVEVVRCKDCKQYAKNPFGCHCVLSGLDRKENDFCSRGERRTDDG